MHEILNKQWSVNSVNTLIVKIDRTVSIIDTALSKLFSCELPSPSSVKRLEQFIEKLACTSVSLAFANETEVHANFSMN